MKPRHPGILGIIYLTVKYLIGWCVSVHHESFSWGKKHVRTAEKTRLIRTFVNNDPMKSHRRCGAPWAAWALLLPSCLEMTQERCTILLQKDVSPVHEPLWPSNGCEAVQGAVNITRGTSGVKGHIVFSTSTSENKTSLMRCSSVFTYKPKVKTALVFCLVLVHRVIRVIRVVHIRVVHRVISRVVLDSFFSTDSTLTHMTIQVTQLRLNSNPKFANLTQLRLNSKPKFTNLTQLWLNSFESELSQIWLTTHHILPNLGKICWPGGGGVRSNVAVDWFFLCKVTDNCKILTFSLRKICDSTLTQAVSSWLNSDSNDNQRDSTLTRLISWIFTADSTLTRLIWVRVESNLTHDSWLEHNPGHQSHAHQSRAQSHQSRAHQSRAQSNQSRAHQSRAQSHHSAGLVDELWRHGSLVNDVMKCNWTCLVEHGIIISSSINGVSDPGLFHSKMSQNRSQNRTKDACWSSDIAWSISAQRHNWSTNGWAYIAQIRRQPLDTESNMPSPTLLFTPFLFSSLRLVRWFVAKRWVGRYISRMSRLGYAGICWLSETSRMGLLIEY